MQLKMRVQRLRKDGKLDGDNSLQGAGLMYSSNLQALMGLSRIGEEVQRLEESELIKQMEKDGKDLSCSDFKTKNFITIVIVGGITLDSGRNLS